jgi:hypothetical protein
MKNKKTLYLVFVVIICISLLPFIQKKVNNIKEKKKLTDTNIVKNAPPVVAFTTIALGGFRGLLADILWLRTISLQRQGKYIEMAQLASWISKLQPRFTGATVFLAWNMAYNISITYSEPKKKWRWVKNGMNLIRDSIKYNPGSPILFKELSWIYINKIGGSRDYANLYFKTQLAIQIEKISGKKNLDINSLYKISEEIKTNPDIISDIQIRLKKLKDLNCNSLDKLLHYLKKHGTIPSIISDKFTKEEIKIAIGYFKIKMLKNELSMDINSMHQIYEIFGDIDWRLSQTQALYWIMQAIKIAPENNEYKSIQNIIFLNFISNGTLLLLDKSDYNNFTTYPNFNAMSKIKNYLQNSKKKKIYLNFLDTCIPILYNHGKYKEAKLYLKEAAEKLDNNKYSAINIQQYMNYYWKDYLIYFNKSQVVNLIDKQISIGYILYALDKKKVSNTQFKLVDSIYQNYRNVQPTVKLPEYKNELNKVLLEIKERLPAKLAKKLNFSLDN